MMNVKVVSINIERRKHLDKVAALVQREMPDIVCLMEVCENDVETLAGNTYPYTIYAPNDIMPKEEGKGSTGVAILSKQKIEDEDKFYCGEDPTTLLAPLGASHTHLPILVFAKIGELQIGAIHFSWTANGDVDERQRAHAKILLDYLSTKEDLVICGDFNIPRGNELYQLIAESYRDNMPPQLETTLDPILHRANFEHPGKLKFVVDYVWNTPGYKVSNLKVVEGVSDHCAIIYAVSCD